MYILIAYHEFIAHYFGFPSFRLKWIVFLFPETGYISARRKYQLCVFSQRHGRAKAGVSIFLFIGWVWNLISMMCWRETHIGSIQNKFRINSNIFICGVRVRIITLFSRISLIRCATFPHCDFNVFVNWAIVAAIDGFGGPPDNLMDLSRPNNWYQWNVDAGIPGIIVRNAARQPRR